MIFTKTVEAFDICSKSATRLFSILQASTTVSRGAEHSVRTSSIRTGKETITITLYNNRFA